MDTAGAIGLLGIAGAVIGGYANVPQINHLIREKCSAGISLRAYRIWTFSSAMLLINALYINSLVFITLSGIQLISSITILVFSARNKTNVCQSHLLGINPLS